MLLVSYKHAQNCKQMKRTLPAAGRTVTNRPRKKKQSKFDSILPRWSFRYIFSRSILPLNKPNFMAVKALYLHPHSSWLQHPSLWPRTPPVQFLSVLLAKHETFTKQINIKPGTEFVCKQIHTVCWPSQFTVMFYSLSILN